MRALFGAACALSCLVPRLAHAAPLGAAITVERSDRGNECPDAPELTRQVERILQRSLESDPGGELEVQVRFSWSREQFSADVVSRGPKPGERVLRDRGQSCAALAEAVSVTIALLLDKELEARASGAAEQAAPSAGANGKAQSSVPPKPKLGTALETNPLAAHGGGAPLEVRAAVEGGAAFGLVGRPGAILTEELGVRILGSLLLDAGFSAVLPGTTAYGVGRVRTTLLFGSARACYVWGERFSVGPCALFGVGRLQGVGIGYETVATENLLFTAFGVGTVAEGPMWGRVFWGLSGVLWVPTHGSSFEVQNVGTAWESSAVAGTVALRVGFRIW